MSKKEERKLVKGIEKIKMIEMSEDEFKGIPTTSEEDILNDMFEGVPTDEEDFDEKYKDVPTSEEAIQEMRDKEIKELEEKFKDIPEDLLNEKGVRGRRERQKEKKTVLDLDSKEAIEFFLKSDQYHNFELPKYFVFDNMLKRVKEAIGDKPYEECLKKGASAEQLPDVNIDILLNKDGHYAVRPIVLANPFLYYFLVRELCHENAWEKVKTLFKHFQVPHITSCAIPVIPKANEKFHKATTILNWWNMLEQRSIELSLEYRYMFVTDITNCYGSVNPQSFDWAFSLKDTNQELTTENPIAKNIQKYLRAFQQGRNLGIPQGSAIFDFIGEIILGYSDLLLHEAIQKENITARYEILRYRDDYRIFCNDKDALEKISYILQHVLEKLNFRMNSSKTKLSESIITDSIKPDKLAYIFNTPIYNKRGMVFDSFQKYLLFILMFSRKQPDSGIIRTLLSDIDERIKEWLGPDESEVKEKKDKSQDEKNTDSSNEADTSENIQERRFTLSSLKEFPPRNILPGGTVRVMVAICVQIAIENVGCSHYAIRVLSRMIKSLEDEEERRDIIERVRAKISNRPNSKYNQIWLQVMSYKLDKDQSPYDMNLCRLVAGDKDVALWNNEWLKTTLERKAKVTNIIDKKELKETNIFVDFGGKGDYIGDRVQSSRYTTASNDQPTYIEYW